MIRHWLCELRKISNDLLPPNRVKVTCGACARKLLKRCARSTRNYCTTSGSRWTIPGTTSIYPKTANTWRINGLVFSFIHVVVADPGFRLSASAVADPKFSWRGLPTPKVGVLTYYFLPKTAWKWKHLDPQIKLSFTIQMFWIFINFNAECSIVKIAQNIFLYN